MVTVGVSLRRRRSPPAPSARSAQPAPPDQRPPRSPRRARRRGRGAHEPQGDRRRLHPRCTRRDRARALASPLPPRARRLRVHERVEARGSQASTFPAGAAPGRGATARLKPRPEGRHRLARAVGRRRALLASSDLAAPQPLPKRQSGPSLGVRKEARLIEPLSSFDRGHLVEPTALHFLLQERGQLIGGRQRRARETDRLSPSAPGSSSKHVTKSRSNACRVLFSMRRVLERVRVAPALSSPPGYGFDHRRVIKTIRGTAPRTTINLLAPAVSFGRRASRMFGRRRRR
jgi:hypothetical protein